MSKVIEEKFEIGDNQNTGFVRNPSAITGVECINMDLKSE